MTKKTILRIPADLQLNDELKAKVSQILDVKWEDLKIEENASPQENLHRTYHHRKKSILEAFHLILHSQLKESEYSQIEEDISTYLSSLWHETDTQNCKHVDEYWNMITAYIEALVDKIIELQFISTENKSVKKVRAEAMQLLNKAEQYSIKSKVQNDLAALCVVEDTTDSKLCLLQVESPSESVADKISVEESRVIKEHENGAAAIPLPSWFVSLPYYEQLLIKNVLNNDGIVFIPSRQLSLPISRELYTLSQSGDQVVSAKIKPMDNELREKLVQREYVFKDRLADIEEVHQAANIHRIFTLHEKKDPGFVQELITKMDLV